MPTTRGRLVAPNQVVYDQADFFETDGATRVLGLPPSAFQLQVFYNNVLLGWTLVDGTTIPDPQVVSGRVYIFQTTLTGPYGIRWRPNANGYWRLLLTLPIQPSAPVQILAQDYDVTPAAGTVATGEGLQTSFVRPGSQCDC